MDRPWSRLHIDFAGPLKGQYYLIVVDSFSKWPEVMKYKNHRCSGTIRFLYELIARFGIPDTIVLNDRIQFMAKEFKDFCEAFLIVHTTTAPYYLQSNGQAERFVDAFKRTLKKLDGNKFVDGILQFLRVFCRRPNPSTNA